MKNGQVALAFTGGYLFGRGHRVGLALTLAGMAAGRRLASGHLPGGVQDLASSEIGRLRGQLVSAGRSAALSAASHRMDALSDRLEERASSLRPNGHGPDGHKADGHKADDEEHERRGGGRSRGESSRGESSRGDSSRGGASRGESSRGESSRGGDRTDRPRKRPASEGRGGGEARRSGDDKGGKGDR